MSLEEEGSQPAAFMLGIMLGIMLGPLALAAILALLASLLGISVICVRSLWWVGVILTAILKAVYALLLSVPSLLIVPWCLVAAQILIGVLLGFAVGLRVQKPRVVR